MTTTPTVPTQGGHVQQLAMLIGGEWCAARSGQTVESLNPATGEVWATIPRASHDDVDRAVTAARAAFDGGPWEQAVERGRLMRRLAEIVRANVADLATIESIDNGKLLRETLVQVAAVADWLDFFAGLSDKINGSTVETGNPHFFAYTRKEPIGVVAAITPWNSPLFLLVWKLAPALAAGCTFIAKPSENTSASTLLIGSYFAEAGFPAGVFNVVTGMGAEVGGPLVRHPGVDKVAFTGSTSTGIRVMQDAATHLAPVSLELGGKSPNIVFDDADLDLATNGALAGIFGASGQTCLAGSRLLVQRGVHDELVDRVVSRASDIVLGDPLLPTTEMGPISTPEQLAKVESYIKIGVGDGAQLVCGGSRAGSGSLKRGFFFPPTIFTQVNNGMRLAREEIFGPVLAVIPFDEEEEAIAIGNDSEFGLAAGVWTEDIRRAHRVAHRLRVGTVWINSYRTLSYAVPFGGFKGSGIGRENGVDAVLDYMETKSVWVELYGEARDPFRLG